MSGLERSQAGKPTSPDELIAFVTEMDCCWIERRFEDLSSYIATDVVYTAPGGQGRLEGLTRALDSYRSFMEGTQVDEFRAWGHQVTQRGDAAVVEYEWEIAWRKAEGAFREIGREILVLSRRQNAWQVVWRMQQAG